MSVETNRCIMGYHLFWHLQNLTYCQFDGAPQQRKQWILIALVVLVFLSWSWFLLLCFVRSVFLPISCFLCSVLSLISSLLYCFEFSFSFIFLGFEYFIFPGAVSFGRLKSLFGTLSLWPLRNSQSGLSSRWTISGWYPCFQKDKDLLSLQEKHNVPPSVQ